MNPKEKADMQEPTQAEAPHHEDNDWDKSIPCFEIPALATTDAVSGYDRLTFELKPNLRRFLRRCLPIELPPGEYNRICGSDKTIYKLVAQVRPGLRLAALLTIPLTQSPQELCRELENNAWVNQWLKGERRPNACN